MTVIAPILIEHTVIHRLCVEVSFTQIGQEIRVARVELH
jgi:hypothetical protein